MRTQIDGDLLTRIRILADQAKGLTPHPFADAWRVDWWIEPRYNVENAILGSTSAIIRNTIFLSPLITDLLTIPGAEGLAANTITHELTHVWQQRRPWWPFLNLPLISALTTEKWASQNGEAAAGIFWR